jgi:CRISPR system Cascade subunit CasC
VAHALTTHRVDVEDDYFTAVDDLKPRDVDAGAGHVGEQEFVAGLFYLYLCIDRDLLLRNLGGDEALARSALRALTEAAAKIGPKGKQASFASRAYASYALAERGSQQPRSLSVAFLKPVKGEDLLDDSKRRLGETCARLDEVYGPCADSHCIMDASASEGTLAALQDFMGA